MSSKGSKAFEDRFRNLIIASTGKALAEWEDIEILAALAKYQAVALGKIFLGGQTTAIQPLVGASRILGKEADRRKLLEKIPEIDMNKIDEFEQWEKEHGK